MFFYLELRDCQCHACILQIEIHVFHVQQSSHMHYLRPILHAWKDIFHIHVSYAYFCSRDNCEPELYRLWNKGCIYLCRVFLSITWNQILKFKSLLRNNLPRGDNLAVEWIASLVTCVNLSCTYCRVLMHCDQGCITTETHAWTNRTVRN